MGCLGFSVSCLILTTTATFSDAAFFVVDRTATMCGNQHHLGRPTNSHRCSRAIKSHLPLMEIDLSIRSRIRTRRFAQKERMETNQITLAEDLDDDSGMELGYTNSSIHEEENNAASAGMLNGSSDLEGPEPEGPGKGKQEGPEEGKQEGPEEGKQEDKEGNTEPLKLDRLTLRLAGLDSYVLVSVLTATASYSTIGEAHPLSDGGNISWLDSAQLLCSAGSTLCGMYSTVVFSLCVLYGKTSLGMGRDEIYSYFMDSTANQRFRGFQAFSASLLLFCIEVFLAVAEKVPSRFLFPTLFGSGALVWFGYSEWKNILNAAQPIFTGKLPPGVEKK